MTSAPDGDRALRYLLGELPEAERDTLEEEYFSQDEAFAELKAVEDDLIDAYCRGALSPERRVAFEARWLQSESGRRRPEFAHALGSVAARGQRPASAPPGARTAWGAWAAGLAALAACLVLAVRVGQLEGELRRARADGEAAREAVAAQERRVQEQERKVAGLAGEAGPVALPDNRRHPRRLLVLAGGLRRDFEPVPRLVLEPDTTEARLTLLLKADGHPTYQVSIQTVEGRDLWVRDGLQATRTERGPALVLAVPAANLSPGHHVVMVTGRGQRPPDTQAEYVFQVVSRR